jgi:uncharacterized Tic20 family protein
VWGEQPPAQPAWGEQSQGQQAWGQQPQGPQAQPPYGQPPYGQPPYGQQQPPAQGYGQDQRYGQQYPPPQQQYPPAPQYPGQPPAVGQQPLSPSDEKLWATLAHISIPFFGFIGPLIVYVVFKDRGQWLKDSSVEALNFSILYSIAQIVSTALTAVVIGAFLLPLLFVAVLVFCILAAMAANKGELYKYPVNWRLIK